MLISIRFVAACDDFKSFSSLFIFLFRQVIGDFPGVLPIVPVPTPAQR